MRWLLIKDLQILRRSPLLVALLVIYPIVIAVLFGFALSGGPEKPRVAFANLVPRGESEFTVGGRTLDAADYADRLFESIDPVPVDSREEAIAKVRSGDALGALVLPADATERLRSMLSLGGGDPPTVEVYYNAEDPVKRRFVESTIEARIGRETSRFSAASSANRSTCSSAARSGESRGSVAAMLSMIAWVRSSPRIWTAPSSGSGISPPRTMTSM